MRTEKTPIRLVRCPEADLYEVYTERKVQIVDFDTNSSLLIIKLNKEENNFNLVQFMIRLSHD